MNRLYPESRKKRVNGDAISENTPPAGGRPVEEEAKRERNRSDVMRAGVVERRKGAKSPKNAFEEQQNAREEDAGASLFTDLSFDKWQRHLTVFLSPELEKPCGGVGYLKGNISH
ncbi:hypothetical protein TNCV_3092891 [Trichonephila clavipes]|uniref:Uncharacterized protein n=1 Tax=Trichonephila clavipes TaxID=2585209 RepID=A0A8X6SAW4_TRICX|nr:hypothetical protein TNCV_3092891 [Trichonephila clavipes]